MKRDSIFALSVFIFLLCVLIGTSYYRVYAQQSSQLASTYSVSGQISSQAAKFILAGPWVLDVRAGNVVLFVANITAALPDGERLHYHTFSNFHQTPRTSAQLNGNNSGTIYGTMDVGLDRKLNEWPQVPTIISIKNGTAISIVLNDASRIYPVPPAGPATTAFAHFTGSQPGYNAHTGSQPVYGLVKQLTRTYTIEH